MGPGAIESALVAAETYLNRQDLHSAEAILQKLLEKAPDSYRARELLGAVLYLKGAESGGAGDREAAAALFQESYRQYAAAVRLAVEQDPSVAAGVHQSAGEIASVAGLTSEALQHFRAAGSLDPGTAKHPLYEAQMLLQLERLDEAREALDRVLELDPDEAFAHASLATIAMKRGDVESALGHIEQARQIEPASLPIRLAESRIRRGCNQPRRALELLLALDADTRAQRAVTSEIVESYRALGDHSGAARAWEHRFRSHPSEWRAAVAASQAWVAAGDREAAAELLDRARLAAPDAPEVRALAHTIYSSSSTPDP